MTPYEQNRVAWNSLAHQSSPFAKVATDAECAQPLVQLDSRGWLPGSVRGVKVLCLAAGGGWQSILYAAAGAEVTVVDLSPGMLRLDAQEADAGGCLAQVVNPGHAIFPVFHANAPPDVRCRTGRPEASV